MIERIKLSESDLKYAIEHGDFSTSIIHSGPRTAVILTQSWCPQWVFMRAWLSQLSQDEEVPHVVVFEAEYNRMGIFNDFKEFKEAVFNNWEVPYIRYYQDGKLHGESNFVSSMSFLDFFT